MLQLRQQLKVLCVLLAVSILAACGGGGGGGGSSGAGTASADGSSSTSSGGTPKDPVTQVQAARFLTQATYGPTMPAITALSQSFIEDWIEAEFAKPQTLNLTYIDQAQAALPVGQTVSETQFFETFWKQAATSDDQLRQRMELALSEIFVVAFSDNIGARHIASYYDMLGRDAFGNFRTLLEDVTLHPAMGIWLTHIHNQKEDIPSGRVPDENYAREVMQLFTIGLYDLNQDGSQKLTAGKPTETYTNADVSGMAKVFTGWSWGGPDKTDNRFFGGSTAQDPNRDVIPMQSYPKYHSISAKTFLGVTIAAQSSANTEGDLKIALDTLFNHPNTGPFIGKQLIQRLVTSNPSPAYVSRVAAAFNNNGSGVRGDMKAVIRAILLDSEARSLSVAQGPNFGKLREPVVRLANWMRAFGATSTSGKFAIGNTDNASSSLGQSPMRSPSVFNFYRPGYVPPNTNAATAGLVVPEMQITHETSVAGYINYMQGIIQNTVSASVPDRVYSTYANEMALADKPDQLVDRINLLLLAGGLRDASRTQIIAAVSGITVRTNTTANTDADHLSRVRLAILLAMASPEYIVQK